MSGELTEEQLENMTLEEWDAHIIKGIANGKYPADAQEDDDPDDTYKTASYMKAEAIVDGLQGIPRHEWVNMMDAKDFELVQQFFPSKSRIRQQAKASK